MKRRPADDAYDLRHGGGEDDDGQFEQPESAGNAPSFGRPIVKARRKGEETDKGSSSGFGAVNLVPSGPMVAFGGAGAASFGFSSFSQPSFAFGSATAPLSASLAPVPTAPNSLVPTSLLGTTALAGTNSMPLPWNTKPPSEPEHVQRDGHGSDANVVASRSGPLKEKVQSLNAVFGRWVAKAAASSEASSALWTPALRLYIAEADKLEALSQENVAAPAQLSKPVTSAVQPSSIGVVQPAKSVTAGTASVMPAAKLPFAVLPGATAASAAVDKLPTLTALSAPASIAAPAPVPAFTFGMPTAGKAADAKLLPLSFAPAPAPAPAFQFGLPGAPAAAPAPLFNLAAVPAAPVTSSAPVSFSFGQPAGSSSGAPPVAFSFGGAPAESATPFTFGTAPAPAPAPPSSSFSAPAAPVVKKDAGGEEGGEGEDGEDAPLELESSTTIVSKILVPPEKLVLELTPVACKRLAGGDKEWKDLDKGTLRIATNPDTKKSRAIFSPTGVARVLLNAQLTNQATKVESLTAAGAKSGKVELKAVTSTPVVTTGVLMRILFTVKKSDEAELMRVLKAASAGSEPSSK